MYSYDISDKLFNLSKNHKQTQTKKVMDSKPAKPDTSSKTVSLFSKNTAVSLVDRILLDESSCDKHSKTGTVNKAKRLQKRCYSCLSTSHEMSKCFENEKKKQIRRTFFKKQENCYRHGILKNNIRNV